MADNINVNELRKAVYALFNEAHSGNQEAQRILELIGTGKATYATITPYSELVGKFMSSALRETITEDFVTDGFLDSAVANGVVAPAVNRAYDVSASAAYDVQKSINQSAGVSFNPVRPQIDRSRVQNLVEKLSGTEFEKTKWLLNEDVLGNISRSAVTDSIRQNAKLHKDAGMHAYLARYSKSGCCEWCDSVSGKFEYGDEPDGFWRIHKHCNCIIEYKPSHYGKADIISYVTGEDGNIRKVTQEGIDDTNKNGILKADRTVSGHEGTPKRADPGAIIDHMDRDQKIDTRTFYGENGLKEKDINTTAHGNPKMHSYGKNGEHAHVYEWDSNGNLKSRTTRELTDEERKENSDIL